MYVYYVKRFTSVIVARDRYHAFNLLHDELRKKDYILDFKNIDPKEFIQLDVNSPHALILGVQV